MRDYSRFRHGAGGLRALHPMAISLSVAVLLLGGCSAWCRTQPPVGSISGRVVDPQDHAIGGVEVRLDGRLVGVTDPKGRYAIRAVPPNDRLAVSFSAPKYMSTTRIFGARTVSDGNTVVIWPRATPVRLPTAEGGKLEFDGATIVFPPDAFVDVRGRQVKGDVNVSLSVLDLADPRQLASAPGDFTARMRDGSIQNLETFGLFELVVTDDRGRRVNFVRDRMPRVELNVPEGGRELPQSVGLFSFDERSGRWVQRPSTWQLQSSTLSTTLVQDGPSVWWNADLAYDTSCLQVQALGCRGCEADSVGILGVTVTATGDNYSGEVTTGTTDANGFVCLPVKKAALVRLDVSQGSLHGNALVVATPSGVVNRLICPSCPPGTPLVTATHLSAPSFTAAQLATHDSLVWCASDNYWNKFPFGVGWRSDPTHVSFSSSGLKLTMNDEHAVGVPCSASPSNCAGQSYASGEYKTTCFHGYGLYTATITPPAQPFSGIVTGFFTYTIDGTEDGTIGENNPTSSWDEVDIEILGRPTKSGDIALVSNACQGTPLILQTNYFAKGVGLHEKAYCLPYGTYTYSFMWTASNITWSVNGTAIRTENRVPGLPWPTQPGRVFMNLWANTSGQSWVGPFSYNGPRSAVFSNVSVP